MNTKGIADKCPLAERYGSLTTKRSGFLARAERFAKMTLPYLFNEKDETNKRQYQGLGAQAVKHLANKLVQTLYPVTEPFFTLSLDPALHAEFQKRKGSIDMNIYFNKLTQMCMRHFRKLKMRSKLIEFYLHLIVSGNGLLVFLDDDTVKFLSLKKYVVVRDHSGKLMECITEEKMAIGSLSPELKMMMMAKHQELGKKQDHVEQKEVKLYTQYRRVTAHTFVIKQSLDGLPIHESEVGEDLLPIVVGRWNHTSGEDYGRGQIEDHEGDFHGMNFLAHARAKGAAIMMDVKYLVRPGAMTDVKSLNESDFGEFVLGMEDDISVLQLDKYADGRLIQDVISEYRERIGRAFLMLNENIRDSERTTKYEIYKVANELDLSMGGIYSAQAEDTQPHIARQLMDMVAPELLDEDLEPNITTGIDSLGRADVLERLIQYSELMSLPAAWSEERQRKLNWDKYSELIASNVGLDGLEELFITDEEAQPEGGPEAQGADPLTSSLASTLGKGMGEKILQQQ